MKIQQNMDVQNNFIQDQTGVNSASKSHTTNKIIGAISGANFRRDSLIAQLQGLAKKQALKVVSVVLAEKRNLMPGCRISGML